MRRRRFTLRIDAPLPRSRPARVGMVIWLAVGGAVALFVLALGAFLAYTALKTPGP